jgi:hypothetical protein
MRSSLRYILKGKMRAQERAYGIYHMCKKKREEYV